jgi:deoxyribose-phosphate aldolase
MLSQYVTNLDDATVQMEVEKIVRENYEKYNNVEVYKQLFNCIDLTTLRSEDHVASVANFVKRVNAFEEEYGDMPNVAAICVYPNFAGTVRMNLEVSDVNIAAVSGGFPSSQTFTEIKVAETMLAVKDGADEIDMVINVGDMLAGNYEEVCDDISELKSACGEAHLKVILETGALKTAETIKKASLLAIYSGADFIKTSTGKQEPAATLEAAYVMCQAIKEYYDKTGKKIGFKPAGGISTTADAIKYYCVVAAVLGEDWLNNTYFRIGASRLANNLLTDICGKEVKFF